MWLGPIWKVAPMRSMNSNLMTHKKLVFDSQCKPAQSYGGLKWIQMYWGGRVLLKCSTSLQFRSVIHHWWPFKKVVCFSLTYLILNAWNNVDFHLNLFMPLSMSDPYIDECMVWIININNASKTPTNKHPLVHVITVLVGNMWNHAWKLHNGIENLIYEKKSTTTTTTTTGLKIA